MGPGIFITPPPPPAPSPSRLISISLISGTRYFNSFCGTHFYCDALFCTHTHIHEGLQLSGCTHLSVCISVNALKKIHGYVLLSDGSRLPYSLELPPACGPVPVRTCVILYCPHPSPETPAVCHANARSQDDWRGERKKQTRPSDVVWTQRRHCWYLQLRLPLYSLPWYCQPPRQVGKLLVIVFNAWCSINSSMPTANRVLLFLLGRTQS